jgi:hypothetical protein
MAAYRMEWSRVEDGFNETTIRAVVTDTYSELFTSATAPLVNCLSFGKLKQAIDPETAKFSEDELEIVLDRAAVANSDDSACFTMLLQAVNPNIARFVILFIKEGSADYKQIFRGVIDSRMAADDYLWQGASFGTSQNPQRVWKMTARVYNNAVLDINIDTVLPQTGPAYIATFKADNVANRPGYAMTPLKDHTGALTGKTFGAYFGALVDLNKMLRLCLDYAEDYHEAIGFEAIIERTTLPYRFTYPRIQPWYTRRWNDLGKQTVRTVFLYEREQTAFGYLTIGDSGRDSTLSPIATDSTTLDPADKSPFVNWYMFFPRTSQEKALSVMSSKTLLSLLYEVARSFAMFLQLSYDDDGVLHIAFLSREQVFYDAEGGLLRTFFADAEKASLTTEPVVINATTEKWVGISCPWAADGFDKYERRDMSADGKQSDLYKEYSGNENRLLFTISPTIYKVDTVGGKGLDLQVPWRKSLCAIDYDPGTGLPAVSDNWYHCIGEIAHNAVCYSKDSADPASHGIEYADIHTGLYLKTQDKDWESSVDLAERYQEKGASFFTEVSTPYDCWRPVSAIQIAIDGETRLFNTIAEYLNELVGRDGTFLKKEYSVEVPYLTRFKATTIGSESFFNVAPGRTTTIDDEDYSIVSVERDLNNFTTSLKMRLLEQYDGSQSIPNPTEGDEILSDSDGIGSDKLFEGGTVIRLVIEGPCFVGDPIALGSGGIAERAFATADYYGRVIGVSLSEFDPEAESLESKVIDVCVAGICDARLNTTVGERVWLRDLPGNIGDEPISLPDSGEHLYQSVGYALSNGLMFVEISQPILMEY